MTLRLLLLYLLSTVPYNHPFQKPIIGREAISTYMRAEAQGLNIMPSRAYRRLYQMALAD